MEQRLLFGGDERPSSPVRNDWVPAEPPSLSGVNEVDLDLETTGLKWWKNDRPIGIAVGIRGGPRRYLPFGHRGGNLDEEAVRRWARAELRGKRLRGFNLKFDAHMMREWGVDLEELGCTLNDVSLSAALLDDHRVQYTLDSVAIDYVGVGKVKGLPMKNLADLHASEVAPYAEQDVNLTDLIDAKMQPLLSAEGLQRVKQLEDRVVFVVCEMERNAAPIDEGLLREYESASLRELIQLSEEIREVVGRRIDVQKPAQFEAVFYALGITPSVETRGSRSEDPTYSFADDVLDGYDHPVIKKLQYARRLASLRNKYITAYLKAVEGGLLRYQLHQLRGDQENSDGTISGRFSSSDKNIQQVMTVEKQKLRFGGKYVIRRLFKPAPGRFYLAADAAQIEYRLFADKSRSPKILEAYRRDPKTSYHKIVWEMVRPYAPEIQYKEVKNLNFAKLYGAGVPKIASMLGVSQVVASEFVTAYNIAFPEVSRLLHLASSKAEERGWVKTLLGRRVRFKRGCRCLGCIKFNGQPRYHKALNGVIQGSAADEMKTKLVELHAERKYTGMTLRMTVHDEADGDVPDLESARRVDEVLNRQSFKLRVPILWETSVGPNWGEVTALKEDQFAGTTNDGTRGFRSRPEQVTL